jgi:hypothetical protein
MKRNQHQSKARVSGSVPADPELNSDSRPLCGHIYKHGRQCRQPVAKPGEILCSTHLRSHALAAPPTDALAEIASELGAITEIHEVGAFIAKLMKLACQSRITFRRAVSLTYMANSLINAIRLQRAEDVRAAKDPGELRIDWTDVPRPEHDRIQLAQQQPASDTLHTPVPA